MAVANTKATAVSNADATPPVLNSNVAEKAMKRCTPFVVEVAAADDDNSVYRIARLPSHAVVLGINVMNDAITGGSVYHCGVHQTAANGGAVVDNDVFATSVDMSSARAAPLDIAHEALNIDTIGQRLWQVLGLSTDPQRDYDITLTGATVGTAAGTIAGWIDYIA